MDYTKRRGIKSLIFIDGGDPDETAKAKKLLGFIDGQTTNPTLVSRNPDIKTFIDSGKKFTKEDLLKQYKAIVQEVSKVSSGPCSIETHATMETTVEELLHQAREMAQWIPNAYIKFPTIPAGLEAAHRVVSEGIRVNMTLCFSQEQAAAVYAATLHGQSAPLPGYYEGHSPVYVSPFVGRLDDRGENGMDVIVNILEMLKGQQGDDHLHVLTASVRTIDHLFFALHLESPVITLPYGVFEQWGERNFELSGKDYIYDPNVGKDKALKEIPYREISLDRPWQEYNIQHDLTDSGLVRFAKDWENLLIS